MHLICDVVEHLKPVARKNIGERNKFHVRIWFERIPLGEGRLPIRGPHVCENESVPLEGGICSLANCGAQSRAFVRFRRRFNEQAVTVKVESVVAAAYATILNDAIFQRGAAMGAVSVHYGYST